MKCGKCLYRANCQFLAKHKGAEVEGCTAFKDATDFVEVVRSKDCVYEDTTSCPLCYIEKHTLQFINHDGAFYCAKGKRKDGE